MSKVIFEGPVPVRTRLSRVLSAGIAFAVLAVLSVSFVISFAALVYSGPLAGQLGKGIGLALLGAVGLPLVVSLRGSFRGTIAQPQDVPALLLAGAAGGISAALGPGETAFATVATLTGVSSLSAAAALYLAGRWRLGTLARYLPYPVIGGFLSATGLLLLIGALSMLVKQEVSVWSLAPLTQPGVVWHWGAWLLFSLSAVIVLRATRSELALPVLLMFGAAGFYAALWLLGIDLETAGRKGLLLGPFEAANFLQGLSPALPLQAQWGLILHQIPTVIAIAAMAVLGVLVNSSGLEVALGHDFDLERELKVTGFANGLAGMTGGFPGYHLIGETVLAARMGLTGQSSALCVALAAAVTLLFGASALSVFPVGLAASVVAFLGIDLLYEWLWLRRRHLPVMDMAVIWAIVLTAATVGFLSALCVGLLAAVVLFTVSYAGVDVVRLRTTGAARRSSVERGRTEQALLAGPGRETAIFELEGYLFFGTAHRLLDQLRTELGGPRPPKRIVLDFARVTGIDTSAAHAIARIAEACARRRTELTLSAVPAAARPLLDGPAALASASRQPTLDDALLAIESRLLGDARPRPAESLLEVLSRDCPGLDLRRFTEVMPLRKGACLIPAGSPSAEVYQLLTGQLRAEIAGADRRPRVVARLQPGALVGEIAYYAEVPRTAAVLADSEATVLRIDLDLIPDSDQGRAAAAILHRIVAQHLARRLMRMTELFRDAGV
ncbi:SulP family inorganic anion transporter [Salipiger mangrovisoli]|uniref:SLC26A/SulP transporter family protein n=1 Tax=Salipiger mangrovisoli TaxID=2865933 RepID=A0ABR9X6W0_9RHOB|nr:SulP family inorganic anion transporter [Salipiger mangrovisoli]MBE9639345.1 SLC26A/SulP transporter family protein [Salipiger mangrovisoli]